MGRFCRGRGHGRRVFGSRAGRWVGPRLSGRRVFRYREVHRRKPPDPRLCAFRHSGTGRVQFFLTKLFEDTATPWLDFSQLGGMTVRCSLGRRSAFAPSNEPHGLSDRNVCGRRAAAGALRPPTPPAALRPPRFFSPPLPRCRNTASATSPQVRSLLLTRAPGTRNPPRSRSRSVRGPVNFGSGRDVY